MKLHDLHPAVGSRRARTRVGRGIAAGQGKTAGRGTKGQKSRAGASIPGWFEGGQTPIHIRVPKLRGFKNRFRIEYAVVNVGQISAYAEAGRFGVELDAPKAKSTKAGAAGPITVNSETLASAGLIGDTKAPLKILGQGDVALKLFVAADAFSASARSKIEAAGGFVQVLAPEKPAKVERAATAPEAEAEPAADAASADSAPEAVAETEAKAQADAGEDSPAAAPAKPARKRSTVKKDADES